ncbi:MAG: hypothetical protein KAG92_03140 [Deltaproteobacteria bacterium]|nr:hypothetical protein [Deltaproteobacteria bacterium]
MYRFMRKMLLLVAMVGFLGGMFWAPVAAEEVSVSVDAELTLVSQYNWRGMVLNEDLSLQSSLTVAKGGFSFNVWGQMDLTDFGEDECHYTDDCDSRAWQFTEIDFVLDYSHSFDKFTVGVGVIFYEFPNWDHSEDTHEVYLATAYDCLLQPALTIYYDFDEVEAFYLNFAVGHSFAVNDKFSVDLSSSIGWGDSDFSDYNFGEDSNALIDFNFGVAAPYKITDNITVKPFLMFSSIVDSDNRDSVDDRQYCDETDNFYGGLTLAYSF